MPPTPTYTHLYGSCIIMSYSSVGQSDMRSKLPGRLYKSKTAVYCAAAGAGPSPRSGPPASAASSAVSHQVASGASGLQARWHRRRRIGDWGLCRRWHPWSPPVPLLLLPLLVVCPAVDLGEPSGAVDVSAAVC